MTGTDLVEVRAGYATCAICGESVFLYGREMVTRPDKAICLILSRPFQPSFVAGIGWRSPRQMAVARQDGSRPDEARGR